LTKQQLEAFLTDAGVAFRSPDDQPNVIVFNNRGFYVRAIAYDRGDLLHLTHRAPLPENARDAAAIDEILQALEDEYPIVKIALNDSRERPTFTVTAEQYEPPSDITDVFWRTADLVVAVVKDGYRRLSAQGESERASDGHSALVAQLEEELQKGSATGAVDSEAVFAGVKASLAMLVTDRGSATAFCVASDAQASYYVTNAHVVESAKEIVLYRQRPHFEKMRGTVVAQGAADDIDLAVVRVATSGIALLKLHDKPPKNEAPIGVAGYPRVQINAAAAEMVGEVVPAIHLGTITGVIEGGACVQYDALTRPGISGGPVLDLASGEVVAVHCGRWLEDEQSYGIGAAVVLVPFLVHKKIVVQT